MNNIVLIGFMGTGKTTVGRRLAAKLGLDFYDTDEYIKKCEKMSVYDIIKKKGAKYFEGAERFAVLNLADKDGCVISTGGGTVIDPENRRLLAASGKVIWLRAKPETIYENTHSSHNKRFELSGADPQKISEMLEARNKFYEECDFSLDVDTLDVDGTVEEIVRFIKSK